jgi:hypothetical protein
LLHAPFGGVARTEHDLEVAWCRATIKVAMALLPLWPPATEVGGSRLVRAGSGRQPAGRRAKPRAAAVAPHKWLHWQGIWHCAGCGAIACSRARVRKRSCEECPQSAEWLRDLLGNPKGHVLVLADVDGLAMAACTCCGAWAVSLPRRLREVCPKSTLQAGSDALKRMHRGLHPKASVDARLHGLWSVDLARALALATEQDQGEEVEAEPPPATPPSMQPPSVQQAAVVRNGVGAQLALTAAQTRLLALRSRVQSKASGSAAVA